jgi:succinoglycan biosynthesis protein ExoA
MELVLDAPGALRTAPYEPGGRVCSAESALPRVSILIPVRNSKCYIGGCLDAVFRQDYPANLIQIIIADGDSTDGTAEIVRERIRGIADAHLIRNACRIVPTAMNLMTLMATGDVIVRIDGHCEVPPDYVSRCVQHLIKDGVDGVGGSITTVGQTPLSATIAIAMSSPFGVGDSAFRRQMEKSLLADTVPFPAYTKSIVVLAGPYDEELVRDQDDEYNYRIREMGGKLLLDGGLQTRYYSRTSLPRLWKQYFEYGFYKVRVLQKHPLQMRPRQFVPPLFAVCLTLGLFLATVLPWGWIPFAAVASSYAVANLVASAMTAMTRGWRGVALLPAVYAVLHLSYGFGFLMGLVWFWNRWGDKVGKVPRFVLGREEQTTRHHAGSQGPANQTSVGRPGELAKNGPPAPVSTATPFLLRAPGARADGGRPPATTSERRAGTRHLRFRKPGRAGGGLSPEESGS